MVLSLQGLYNSFICLLNEYTQTETVKDLQMQHSKRVACLPKQTFAIEKQDASPHAEGKNILECTVQKHHCNGSVCKEVDLNHQFSSS